MFKHELRNLTIAELIVLARDDRRLQGSRLDQVFNLVGELAERLESLDYMVQATLEGQEAAKEYVPR